MGINNPGAGSGSAANPNVSAVKTSTYAILSTDYTVLTDASGGSFSATLPTAVGITGKIYVIKRADQTFANAVTIATTSSQTIDGITTQHLATQYESIMVQSDGSNWQMLDRKIPGTAFTWTPTVTGLGTVASVSFSGYRQGSNFVGYGALVTGTVAAANTTFTLPSGLSVISGLPTASSGRALIGSWARVAAGALSSTVNAAASATVLGVGVYGITTDPTSIALGTNFGSAEGESCFFSVPITGWEG